jgi:hypothetical protein
MSGHSIPVVQAKILAALLDSEGPVEIDALRRTIHQDIDRHIDALAWAVQMGYSQAYPDALDGAPNAVRLAPAARAALQRLVNMRLQGVA